MFNVRGKYRDRITLLPLPISPQIPCKHVLCYDCAKLQDKCWRCGDRAVRVERAGLGTLHMCLHDGKRYDNNGCRRTYLSQRDLQVSGSGAAATHTWAGGSMCTRIGAIIA